VTLPWLSILWLLPLVGSLLIVLMPAEVEKLAKWVGLFISVLVLLVAVIITAGFKVGGAPYQFAESHQWIPAFGAGYTLGVDGIALVLILLTTVLIPVLLVAGWNDGGERGGGTSGRVGDVGHHNHREVVFDRFLQ